jgi:hypothetical protein
MRIGNPASGPQPVYGPRFVTRKCVKMLVFFKVAEYEATTFSIFYNNSLFLAIVILASFYLLRVRLKFLYMYALFRIRIWIASGFNRVSESGFRIVNPDPGRPKLSPNKEGIFWSSNISVWIRIQQQPRSMQVRICNPAQYRAYLIKYRVPSTQKFSYLRYIFLFLWFANQFFLCCGFGCVSARIRIIFPDPDQYPGHNARSGSVSIPGIRKS